MGGKNLSTYIVIQWVSFKNESIFIFWGNSNCKKRKREDTIREHLCVLSELPKNKFGVVPRQYCSVCKEKNKQGKSKKRVPQTRYFCSIHNIPVCVLQCYDLHINSMIWI